jgi:glucosylceramidase
VEQRHGRLQVTTRTWVAPPRQLRALAVAGALAVLAPTFGVPALAAPTRGDLDHGRVGPAFGWTAWTSSPTDASARLKVSAATSEAATRVLMVHPDQTRQTWRGVGSALTDASVSILSNSAEATARLFDPARADGARLNWVRLPLSATDFSTSRWTFGWDDTNRVLAAPTQATAAATFLTQEVLPLRSDLDVVGVSWSAPAEMKTPATLDGGNLRDDRVAAYGRLLTAQAAWLQERNIPVEAMTLGNEPGFNNGNYPTMGMSDAQMISLANQIGPGLDARDVELWAVDHNWSDRGRVDTVLAGAPGRFSASAFHCYGGNVSQMQGVGAPPIMTECTGTNDTFAGTFRWDMVNLIDGAAAAGSTGLMFWNLALNESHGPRLGGCSTCRGVVDVNSLTGAVTPTPEFYALAHVSRAADPGAVVIADGSGAGLPYVAFRNPDGEIGIVGHNDTGSRQVLAVAVGGAVGTARIAVDNGALFTLRGLPEVVGGSVSLPGVAPQVGVEVNPAISGFAPSPVVLSYEWLADGVPIAGASGATYTPTAAQVGTRLSLRVTGSRAGFRPAVVTSTPSAETVEAPVQAVVNQVAPTISGTPQVGMTLVAMSGAWDPSGTTHAFQWMVEGEAVSGAESDTYVPGPSDVGTHISVRVTASKPGYASAVATAGPTEAVTAASGPLSLQNTVPPKVSGNAAAGRTLTASTGSWDPQPTAFALQWLADGSPIAGATDEHYAVDESDVGSRLSVAVTASKEGYTSTVRISAQTAPVAPGAISNVAPPSVSGEPRVGMPLTALLGSWSPAAESYSYQWLLDGSPISGASMLTFVPTPSMAGKHVSVLVTASRPGWHSRSAWSATRHIELGVIECAAPTFSGAAKVGKRLRARASSCGAPIGVEVRFQWLRDGKPIPSATSWTFKLPKRIKGHKVGLRIVVSYPSYSTLTLTSARTVTVK